jgi:hypothetical protein
MVLSLIHPLTPAITARANTTFYFTDVTQTKGDLISAFAILVATVSGIFGLG